MIEERRRQPTIPWEVAKKQLNELEEEWLRSNGQLLTFSVMVIVAYILGIAAVIAVKTCIGALHLILLAFLLPLQSLVSRSSTADQLNAFAGTCLSAFIAVLAAFKVFQWLSSPFYFTSILVLAVPFIGSDLRRIGRCLRIWHASTIDAGLDYKRVVPSDQPLETRWRFDDVGRETAYMGGDVLGFAVGGWYVLHAAS